MPQAPLYAYLEAHDGGLRLCVSGYRLNAWGDRVVKGRSPPSVVTEHLADPKDLALGLKALAAADRYLKGEEFGLDTPVFGRSATKPARRKKKDLPDAKVV